MVGQVNEHLYIPTKHIVEWTQAFVRHPSPQTERFEHEPQVQSFIGERVVPLVQELGLPWRRDPMGNLLVELGPERADRSLMLMAYAMTHPANRMPDPYAGELIEDASGAYVRGRGVSEQKGSLAAALAAVKAAADHLRLRGRLIFTVSTAGETGRHDAALSICDALGFTPRLAVIVIGTTSCVALANKGRIDAIVTVRGKASHSSTPWVGVNAIDGARRVLDRVMAVDVGANKHPGLGQATLTPTAVRSWPEATHTVQDEVRLVFDRRLLPGDDPKAAFAAIGRRRTSAILGRSRPSSARSCIPPRSLPMGRSCAPSTAGAGAWGCRRRRPFTATARSTPAFSASRGLSPRCGGRAPSHNGTPRTSALPSPI